MSESDIIAAPPHEPNGAATEDRVHDKEDHIRASFVREVLDAVADGDDETARALVTGLHPADIADLIEIMRRLRTPVTGCPWDLEQTFATIAPYTIEEALEVADAITRDDMHDLCDELGDLLLQVVFHARMAE